MGEHDENISFERTVELVGAETAAAIRDASLNIYASAAATAAERGLILADTKFEFGDDPESGELTLADEVLTSDSSRYWDAESLRSGRRPPPRQLRQADRARLARGALGQDRHTARASRRHRRRSRQRATRS